MRHGGGNTLRQLRGDLEALFISPEELISLFTLAYFTGFTSARI
jgi:hypothetical protein